MNGEISELSNKKTDIFFLFFQFHLFLSLLLFPVLLGSVVLWNQALVFLFLGSGFILYWCKFIRESSNGIYETPIDRWLTVYFAGMLLSTIFSKVLYLSCVELYRAITVLTAFLATIYYAKTRERIIRLVLWLTFLGALLSIIGVMQLLGAIDNQWWHRPYFMSSTYVNHNHFAGFLVIIIPVALGMSFAERQMSKKVLLVFLCVLMGVAFIFSLSRGGLIGLIVSILFMAFLLSRRGLIRSTMGPLFLIFGLIVCAVMILGINPIEQRVENLKNMTQDEELSILYRYLTWQGALRMIPHFFLLGSGPGTFGDVFLMFRPAGYTMRPVFAHNDYLQLLTDCGIICFAAMFMVVWVIFKRGWIIIHQDESRLRIGVGSGCMAGLLGLLVHGLFDFNFHIPANFILCAVIAGILFSLDTPAFYRNDSGITRVYKKVFPVLIGICLLFSCLIGLADYFYLSAKNLWRKNQKQSALEAVQKSILFNPFSAESYFLKGFILAMTQEPGLNKPAIPLKASEALLNYEKAVALNRYEPLYNFYKAKALAPGMVLNSPAKVIELYQEVMQKDPNNPKLIMMCAKDILKFDAQKNTELRIFIESILERAISLDSEYAEEAFDLMWSRYKDVQKILAFHETNPVSLKGLIDFLEKNDIWNFHEKYYLKWLSIDSGAENQILLTTKWADEFAEIYNLRDFSPKGKEPINMDTFFFAGGELSRDIIIRNSFIKLELEAKASPVNGTFPLLCVKIDGKVQDVHYMNSRSFKRYESLIRTTPGNHVLTLEYKNDAKSKSAAGEDRNIWISQIKLIEPLEN